MKLRLLDMLVWARVRVDCRDATMMCSRAASTATSGQGGAHGQAVDVIEGAEAAAFECAPEVADEDLGAFVQEYLVPSACSTAGCQRLACRTDAAQVLQSCVDMGPSSRFTIRDSASLRVEVRERRCFSALPKRARRTRQLRGRRCKCRARTHLAPCTGIMLRTGRCRGPGTPGRRRSAASQGARPSAAQHVPGAPPAHRSPRLAPCPPAAAGIQIPVEPAQFAAN